MVVSEAGRRPPLLAMLFGSVYGTHDWVKTDWHACLDNKVGFKVELAYFEHGGILHYVIQKLQLSIY
uniref:Uncharacterized protein n=1 Tax=Oryza nivara TaxID=4536 RepID=A0A0E0HPG0_ORYNI